MKIFTLILFLFFSFGCSSSAPRIERKPKTLPAWYLNPPRETKSTLYATGEGAYKREALNNALLALLAKLRISISSDYSVESVVREGSRQNYHDTTYTNKTQSSISKIDINSYELLSLEKMGFKNYIVLIKVDKKRFFRALQEELDAKLRSAEAIEGSLSSNNALEVLARYNKALDGLHDIENRLDIMMQLEDGFDPFKYRQAYTALVDKRDMLRKKLSFWIVSSEKGLKTPLLKALREAKFTIESKKNRFHFRVFIESKEHRNYAYGFYIVKAKIGVTTKDYKGVGIADNIIYIKGASAQSYSAAKEKLIHNFYKLVEKEGVGKILNLDI